MKKLTILFAFAALSQISSAQKPLFGGFFHYYGHIHNHSTASDGSGSISQAYTYAKNTAHLDFFGLSDHSEQISSSEWNTTKSTANSMNEDGVFTTFWGFEWSSSSLYGHVSVFMSDDYCSSLPFVGVSTFNGLVDWINARECVAAFNHPGREDDVNLEFGHFEGTPTNKFVYIECWNKGYDFDTYYYTDGYFDNDGGKTHLDEANSRGWYIGAGGSEDNHDTDWGTQREYKMVIVAWEHTRAAMYSALKARRVYTTLDRNLMLSWKVNGMEQGSVLAPGTYTAEIRLSDPDGEVFTKVELVHNGALAETFVISETNPVIPVNINGALNDFYYIRVFQADGDEAISSSVFFRSGGVNNAPPQVAVTVSDSSQGSSQEIIVLNIDASDSDGTIWKSIMLIDGQLVVHTNGHLTQVTTDTLSVGTHTVSVIVFDNSEAIAYSDEVTFHVDNITGNDFVTETQVPKLFCSSSETCFTLYATGMHQPGFITIIGMKGEIIEVGWLEPGQEYVVDKSAWTAGIYCITLASPEGKSSVRVFAE